MADQAQGKISSRGFKLDGINMGGPLAIMRLTEVLEEFPPHHRLAAVRVWLAKAMMVLGAGGAGLGVFGLLLLRHDWVGGWAEPVYVCAESDWVGGSVGVESETVEFA